jgi:hypothetical protein
MRSQLMAMNNTSLACFTLQIDFFWRKFECTMNVMYIGDSLKLKQRYDNYRKLFLTYLSIFSFHFEGIIIIFLHC